MCNEREENDIFWGFMLKPLMVTTRNCNIIFNVAYLFFICLGQTYPLIQQKGSIFTIFPLQSLGFKELKFLMENNCISC